MPPASQISIYNGLQGPNTTFSHNEVFRGTGHVPMPFGFCKKIVPRLWLAGGVDELSFVLFHSFSALRALSPRDEQGEKMRPFDRKRNGRVSGGGGRDPCSGEENPGEREGSSHLRLPGCLRFPPAVRREFPGMKPGPGQMARAMEKTSATSPNFSR